MTSLMELESAQIPLIIENQLKTNLASILNIAKRIRKKKLNFIQTIARGSSKNAALFGKYLFETQLNIITSQADLSIKTVYNSNLIFKDSLVIAISQSGQSPDLIEYLAFAKKKQAITIAIVNDLNSPLAKEAEFVISIYAGKEKAIAATKSFSATISTLIQFVASIKQDKILLKNLSILPERLSECINIESDIFFKTFQNSNNLFVIARGYLLPIAKEAALKLKETCLIQAEAYSSAEVLHGPIALVRKNFPILFFFQNDNSKISILEVYQKVTSFSAKTFAFIPCDILKKIKTNRFLNTPKSLDPICDPLLFIQIFYPLCAKLSLIKGKNPDRPKNLSKITKTK
jgi:glutamine---fructose-6-phosphate transaminase (isomerizing)